MTKEMWFEVIGYTGSLLILVSMLMTSVVKLRIINLIGSAVFTLYAILIHSYPTAFLNGCLVLINVIQLLRQRRAVGKSYDVHPFEAGEGFPAWFVGKYKEDILKFFPSFKPEDAENASGYAVFYDDQAAGLLLGMKEGETLRIVMDYATPAFRDCSVGGYLYGKLSEFGVSKLICKAENEEHVKYMEKMGFVRDAEGAYVKELR